MSLVGVDLLDIRRVEKALKKGRKAFLEKICRPSEIEIVTQSKRSSEKAAAIFALKEAFSKALGTGLGADLSFKDIEISYTDRGAPKVSYCGEKFKTRSDKWTISCSISHEGELLVAMVLIDGEGEKCV
jgi:holo-[acyl-carrier protein] synthase